MNHTEGITAELATSTSSIGAASQSAEDLARESLFSLERLCQLAPPRYAPHLLLAQKLIKAMLNSGDLSGSEAVR